MRLPLWASLRVAGTAVLLGLVLARLDLAAVGAALARASAPALAAALSLSYAGWSLNSYKWGRLLARLGAPQPLGRLVHLNLAAVFYSLALPGQVPGEVMKAERLARSAGQTRTVVYRSVLLDRLTGVVGLAGLGLVGVLVSPPAPPAGASVALPLAGAGGVGVAALWLAARVDLAGPLASRDPRGLLRPRPRPGGGLVVPASELAVAVALSTGFQASAVLGNLVLARGLGLDAGGWDLAWVVAIASLAQVLPVSVAGLGVREVTYAATLGILGVPAADAVALSLLGFVLLLLLAASGLALDLATRAHRPPVAAP